METNVLEWSQVNLSIKFKDKRSNKSVLKPLLSNLHGCVKSGELLAILGPTGCGKSSLCNVLSGKISYARSIKLEGNIYYNKKFMDHGVSGRTIGYVGQSETSFAFLTVRETLCLAAYFHSTNMTKAERENLVTVVMKELSLSKVADTILGNERIRGVSGGEYKRVLIGRELIKNPEIILLDEPTSGLDSFQALSVMDTMKKLAQEGKIIVAVIHQPRSSIFELFDKIMLLAEGKLMYSGPAVEAIAYFKHAGYCCPLHFNPADYFLDILSVDVKSLELEKESRERIKYLGQYWIEHGRVYFSQNHAMRSSVENEQFGWDKKWQQNLHILEKDNDSEVTPTSMILTNHQNYPEEYKDPEGQMLPQGDERQNKVDHTSTGRTKAFQAFSLSWGHDFAKLLWRSMVNVFRNYGALIIRALTTLFFAVLVSLIYRNLSYTQKGIQNRTGLLYFVLINQGFSPLIGVLTTLPNDQLIVSREVSAGSYRYSSYYLASVISELPTILVLTVVYSTIIYWSTGLNPTVDRFLIFLGILLLSTTNATALGYFVSSISPNAAVANAIGPPVFIILLLYGGFYINASSLPVGSVWVRNLSLVYWGFQALIINEFEGEHFTCSDVSTSGCRLTGQEVIASLSFEDGNVGFCAGMIAVLIVGFFLLGYFGLLLGQQRYHRIHPRPNNQLECDGDEEVEQKEKRKQVVEGKEEEDDLSNQSIADIEGGVEHGRINKYRDKKLEKEATKDHDLVWDDVDPEEEEKLEREFHTKDPYQQSYPSFSSRYFVA